jgi:hypothetical protein
LKKERELSKKEKRRIKNKAKPIDEPPNNLDVENLEAKDELPDVIEQKSTDIGDKDNIKLEKDLVENEKSKPKQTPLKTKSKQKPVKSERKSKKSFGSDEEEDEDGYSEEAEDDWEWDYGEQWEEGNEKKDQDKSEETVAEVSLSFAVSYFKTVKCK